MAAVGAVAMAFETDSTSAGGSTAFGIILILVAQFFAGGLYVVEEYFVGGYCLDPLKVVGMEGMWGLSYYLAILPIMQGVKCKGDKLCQFGYIENSSYAFFQMKESIACLLLTIGLAISIGFYNVFGITTTKVASAAQRATIDTARTLTVWMASVALGLEPFRWQSIFGFVFLVIGTLIYNEILILRFWGLDQNTKDKLEERDAAQKVKDDHYDGVGGSDEAADEFQMNSTKLKKDQGQSNSALDQFY